MGTLTNLFATHARTVTCTGTVMLRTSNPEYDLLVEEGAWTGIVDSLPILRNGTDTDDKLIVDFTSFALQRKFLLTLPNVMSPSGSRVARAAAYPRNVELEIEYWWSDDGGSAVVVPA